jgi:hypothetical protein
MGSAAASGHRRVFVHLAVLTLIVASAQAAFSASPAQCAPGARPEPGLQGQVPVGERLNGNAAAGYWCNLEMVGGFPSQAFGNFDTYKSCAYYTDNSGFLPGSEGGGVVLDVSDPSHPIKTEYLTSRAMGNGGESLRVNQARGLMVVSYYNIFKPIPTPERRFLSVYSVKEDCAHPRLLADVEMPSALGHEGCFQPDGMVYYMADGNMTITPIDLTDPAQPKQLSDPWPLRIHGCSISDDGKRGYFASVFGEMMIVDTSEAQDRVFGAQPHVIASFQTPDVQVQQSTVPLYYGNHPYVLLWSEIRLPAKVCLPTIANFGYPRILDLADEAHPIEVSKIQTEVVLPENCAAVAADATLQTSGVDKGDPVWPVASYAFMYDSHYCTPDRLHDPTILACAQLGSGLRVYDIRDPHHPSEIAYYNPGTLNADDITLDFSAARPVVRGELGQIWWASVREGFHAVKFSSGVWPFAGDDPCPPGYDYFRAQYDLAYQACNA